MDFYNFVLCCGRCAAAFRTFSDNNRVMLENIPPQALKKTHVAEPVPAKPSEGSLEKKPIVQNNVKPVVKLFSVVGYLTVEEFDKIPKYMKGRMSYDSLSQAIDEFNSCIATKYEFLARPLNDLGLKEKKRRNILKSQDRQDLKGKQFVTSEELKDFSMFKTDSGRKSIFTVLRHFQKIREVRGPGAIIRYVII